MTNWNTLPPEIHDHILHFFCEDIINTYTSLGSRKNICRRYVRWINVETWQAGLQWPAAPICLQHISSATKVCRSFYHSIVHRIKIQAVAPMEHLQFLQYDTVRRITLFPDTRKWTVAQVGVGFFMSLAGVFWKNPKVLEDEQLIIEVLRISQKISVMMLLPHVKEWLYKRAEPRDAEDSDESYTFVNMSKASRWRLDMVADVAVFGTRGDGNLFISDDSESGVSTIDGVYKGFQNEIQYGPTPARGPDEEYRQLQALNIGKQLAKYPILRLIEDAEPHSWWVLALPLGNPIFSEQVFLVNFEERIFWHRRMENVICLWNSGDGMWDPERWLLEEALPRKSRRSQTISETFGVEGGDVTGENILDHSTQSDTDSSVTSGSGMDDEDEDEDEDEDNMQYDWSDRSDWLIKVFSDAFTKDFDVHGLYARF